MPATARSMRYFRKPPSTRLLAAVTDALGYGVSSVISSSLHQGLFPLKTRTGRRLIHNVSLRPLAGEPARCLLQITDVTLATEREKVLRERQNARYDAVVDSAPDAIVTVDAKGVISSPTRPPPTNSATRRESWSASRPASFSVTRRHGGRPGPTCWAASRSTRRSS